MEFHESDYVDESFLEEIQCEKCPYSFPLYLFSEHELMCHGQDNSDNSASDSEIEEIPKAEATVEKSAPPILDGNEKAPTVENLFDQNLLALAKLASEQERNLTEEIIQKDKVFLQTFEDDVQVAEELENERLNSFSSKEKQVEEEKPSFKAPSNILLKGLYTKPHIRNDLPDSDNEDVESLEDFWRRADVKLAQRMRKMEEMKNGSKLK